MALYDFYCDACGWAGERTCLMAERDSLLCECGTVLNPLFSPPSVIYVGKAFGYAFSDLFGTSSEKEYHQANPGLMKVNHSDHSFVSAREERRKRSDEADKTVSSIESAMKANKTLTAPRRGKKA